MANGPSREERRAYANAGKDQYYDHQEKVLFPQAQADIWKQVGQRGQALDQWSFQQQQTKDNYRDQVKYQTDSYKNQIQAFEKSDQIYQQNQKYIQGAYDRKVEEADAQYSETVKGSYFNLEAAQRQFGLDRQKSQSEMNRYDLSIDKMNLQRDGYNTQIGQRQKQYDARSSYIGDQRAYNNQGLTDQFDYLKQQNKRNNQGWNIRNDLYNNQIADNQSGFEDRKGYIDGQRIRNNASYESRRDLINSQGKYNQTEFDNQKARIKGQRERNQTGFENTRDLLNNQITNNQTGFTNQKTLIDGQKTRALDGFTNQKTLLDNQLLRNQSSYESQNSLYTNQINDNISNFNDQISYLDKSIEDVNTRQGNDINQAAYNRDVTEADRKQNVAELNAQKTYLESQRTIALDEKTSRDSQIDLDYQEKVSSGMYEQLSNKIQSIVDQGSISSRGSRGRSVATNLNTTIATAGFNGARLTEGLLRSSAQKDIQKGESTSTYDKVIGGITQEESNNTSRLTRQQGKEAEILNQFTLSQALIIDNATSQKRGINNTKRQEGASYRDRAWNLSNSKKQGLIQRNATRDTLQNNKKENSLKYKDTKAQLKYNKQSAKLNRDNTRDSLQNSKKENRLRKTDIAEGLKLQKQTAKLNKKQTTASLLNRKEENRINRKDTAEQLKFNKKEAKLNRDQTRDSIKANKKENTLNGRKVNDQLKYNAKESYLTKSKANRNLSYDQKQASLSNKSDQFQMRQNRKQLDKDIQDVQERQNIIAAELGFTAEQLDMTAEQLGASILSASEANTRTKENLKRMAKQENLSAFYQRMARPKFTALPKPPYQVDMPKFAPVVKMASPGEFLNASDSGYLNATRPASGPSGISKALSIGGMALGAIAAPFTAGSSLAVSGALMSTGTAAALSGGGALLGGLGKSGLFD